MENIILYQGPLIGKEDAIKNHQTFYFTGIPCKRGHIDQKYVSANCCKQCRINAGKAYLETPKGKDSRRKTAKKYRINNPDLIKAAATKQRNKIKNDKSLAAHINNQRRNRRETQLEEIAGRPRPINCEICQSNKKIHFDHCHISGIFRGWICNRCNTLLGWAKDDSELLHKLGAYLERPLTGPIITTRNRNKKFWSGEPLSE